MFLLEIMHDISLIIDEKEQDKTVLNDYYESDFDTYKSGSIIFPFSNLEEGMHKIEIQVWDINNNSTSARLKFIVANSAHLRIEDLFNYPNPFSERTTFSFQHNKAEEELEYILSIYSLEGRLLRQFSDKIVSTGYSSETIQWNGRDSQGIKITEGLYIYRLILRTKNGDEAQLSSRLLYLRN